MSDEELIARLREIQGQAGLFASAAADRIIDAEKKLRKSALQELSALGQASEAYQAQLAAEAKLAIATWLLTDAAVQLEEGKIKTRRNRAGLIWQFLAEIKGESRD